jgi:hypothetical protein
VGKTSVGRSVSVNVDEKLDFVCLALAAVENAASSAVPDRFLEKPAEGALYRCELGQRPTDSRHTVGQVQRLAEQLWNGRKIGRNPAIVIFLLERSL